jgi:hypothetical protein
LDDARLAGFSVREERSEIEIVSEDYKPFALAQSIIRVSGAADGPMLDQ